MTRLPRHLLLLAALLLALPGAAFGNPERVIKDCAEDGDLDRKYSNAELRGARDNLPADLDEYSDCREVIGGAIKSGSDKGGGRGGGGPDAAAASSPEEQAARAQDQAELEAIASSGKKDPPTVDVGGDRVEPGSNGLFDLASANNSLPTPLLVALIALGLLAVLGALVALRERIPALARLPLLSRIPNLRVPFPRLRR